MSSRLFVWLCLPALVQLVTGTVPEGLYLSNVTDILFLRKSEAGPHSVKSIYKTARGRLVGLALDEDDGKIFWSDIEPESRGIYQASVQPNSTLTNIRHLVSTDIFEINGLTVDWLSKNLYWTDGFKKTIEMINYKTLHRRILVTEQLSVPRGIYADLNNRYLYWTDQGNQRIERSNLDGSARTVLVTGRKLPNQLTMFQGSLYWVNADLRTLESCRTDGTNFRIHYNLSNQTKERDVFGLAISAEGTAYITSWINNYVISAQLGENGKNVSQVTKMLGSDVLFNIVNVDKGSQTSGGGISDVCGGALCSHLCFPTPISATPICACPSYGGLVLRNSTHCTEADGDMLFYVSAESGFVGFLHKASGQRIFSNDRYLVGKSLRPVAVAYDPVKKVVYWSDVEERSIHSVNLNGTAPQIFLNVEHGIGLVNGMALDHESRKLYYTNTGTSTVADTTYSWYRIEVVDLGPRSTIVRTIVTTAEKPRAVTLDLAEKYLYYTDCSDRARIVRTNLDGSNPVEVRAGLDNPNGLALVGSGSSKRLYYIDSHYKTRANENYPGSRRNGSLYSMQLNGSNWINHSLEGNKFNLKTPIGLSTDGFQRIFLTDWDLKSLISIDLATPGDNVADILLNDIESPMMLSYTPVTLSRQSRADGSLCKTHGCEDTCLGSRDGSGETTLRCVCDSYDHRVITSNITQCQVSQSELLVADMGSVRLRSLDGFDQSIYSVIQGDTTSNYVALSVDSRTNILYYSDVNRRTLMSVRITEEAVAESINLFDGHEAVIDGMTVHETDRGSKLYWTESIKGSISYVDLPSDGSTPGVPIIVVTGLSRPRAIKIHNGHVYWSEWGEGKARVARISLDQIQSGSNVTDATEVTTLSTPALRWPNGLYVDTTLARLYIVDGHPTVLKLYNCSISGGDCSEVEGMTANMKHSYDVYVHDDVIYYSDWTRQAVMAYSVKHKTTWPLLENLMRPSQIIFNLRSGIKNFCSENNGGCSDVCVSLIGSSRCVCREGRILSLDDGKTCTPKESNTQVCNISSGGTTMQFVYGETFTPPNEKCVTCKCLAGDTMISDPTYGPAKCSRTGGEDCPIPMCSDDNNGTVISPENCCPVCVKPCSVRITNCPTSTQRLELPEDQGYEILEYLPYVKDCLGLSREIQLSRSPATSVFFYTGPGKLQPVITTASTTEGSDICSFDVEVLDVTSPIIQCPSDVTLYTSSDSTVVKWAAPEIYDNSGLAELNLQSSVSWGSKLGVGFHPVTYTVRDQSGLEASCDFSVTVVKTSETLTCAVPQLLNADLDCNPSSAGTERDREGRRRESRDTIEGREEGVLKSSTGSDGYSCTVRCKDGYTNILENHQIRCVNGHWSQLLDSGFNACMRRQLSISGGLIVAEHNACGKNVYLRYTEDFLTRKIQSKYLTHSNYTFTAKVKADGCMDATIFNKNPGDVNITISLSAEIRDENTLENVSTEMNRLLRLIDDELTKGFLVLMFANMDGLFSSQNPTTKVIPATRSCQRGSVSVNGLCEFCSPGFYADNGSGLAVCKTCPANTYSEREGAVLCTPCPEGLLSNPGSFIRQQCVEHGTILSGFPVWIILVGGLGFVLILVLIIALVIVVTRRKKDVVVSSYVLTEHTPESHLIGGEGLNGFDDDILKEGVYDSPIDDATFTLPKSNGACAEKPDICPSSSNDCSLSGLRASSVRAENNYAINP